MSERLTDEMIKAEKVRRLAITYCDSLTEAEGEGDTKYIFRESMLARMLSAALSLPREGGETQNQPGADCKAHDPQRLAMATSGAAGRTGGLIPPTGAFPSQSVTQGGRHLTRDEQRALSAVLHEGSMLVGEIPSVTQGGWREGAGSLAAVDYVLVRIENLCEPLGSWNHEKKTAIRELVTEARATVAALLPPPPGEKP